ncbi:MAG: murein biosynthesis integral membrane protein MurJ, partial [Desulfotomaculales bacterium]
LADGGLAGALAGGAAALALRLALDALAAVVVFALLCRLLRLDEYLYLEGPLRRAFLRGVGRVRARAL